MIIYPTTIITLYFIRVAILHRWIQICMIVSQARHKYGMLQRHMTRQISSFYSVGRI
jgi:hypothetical protein